MHPHLRTAGSALGRWFVAQCWDALAVAALWAIGLAIIGVPLWPLWAVLGGLLQFVPHIGPMLAVIGPLLSTSARAMFVEGFTFNSFFFVLMLYALIVIIDGLVLQPWLMKRSNRVPIWVSILAPWLLGFLFGLWGVLLAAPLLALVYAFRSQSQAGHGLT